MINDKNNNYNTSAHLTYLCRYHVVLCVKNLKYESAHVLLREFPDIKRRLPAMWTRSAFIATVGSVSLDVVKQYIKDQKGK